MAKQHKTFLVIYHAPASALKKMQSMSPEDLSQGMEKWMAWSKKCGGQLVDMGTPLTGGLKLDPSGETPSRRSVCGYSILKAASMAGAKKLLKGHPHYGYGKSCSIEVHEALPLPGM